MQANSSDRELKRFGSHTATIISEQMNTNRTLR